MNWILRLILRLVVLAGIIWLVVAIVPGMDVEKANGVWTYLWLAVLFSLVNAILGPIFWFFSFPLVILTFGLFLLVVNAGLLAITAGLSSHLAIDNFWAALFGGLLIAVFSLIAELLLPLREKRRPVASEGPSTY